MKSGSAANDSPPGYDLPPPPDPFEQWSLLRCLARRAAAQPDLPLLRWTAEYDPVTFGELASAVLDFAGRLQASGMRPGDRVALLLRNSISHVTCWFASNAVGAVDAPINPAYPAPYLAQLLNTLQPAWLICDASLRPVLQSALAGQAGGGPRILVLDDSADDRASVSPLVHPHTPLPAADPPSAIDLSSAAAPDQPASIMFTSGTTGLSKAVLAPHAQSYFYSYQTQHLHAMTSEDIYLAPYPLFHASGRIHGVGAAIVSGSCCVLYDRFSAKDFAARVVASGATVTHFLGSMMSLILQQDQAAAESASRLRSVMALPTPASQVAEFRSRFGSTNVCEVIGMTELSWPVMSPYGQPRPSGSAGRIVRDWFDVLVADPATDLPVTTGTVGELLVRPRHPWITALGYENNPDATVASWRNLWFHTGDLVRADADGWLYYVDRLKDSIRRRGENIASHEVEQALRDQPGIADAAVVGVPTAAEEHDEEVIAFVVLEPGTQLDPHTIRTAVATRLPHYAVPQKIAVIDALPTTPSGKVRKAELRQRASSQY